jgi:hypothetical protein
MKPVKYEMICLFFNFSIYTQQPVAPGIHIDGVLRQFSRQSWKNKPQFARKSWKLLFQFKNSASIWIRADSRK